MGSIPGHAAAGAYNYVISYFALISAFERGKQPERARAVFQAMQQRGVVPDVIATTPLFRSHFGSSHFGSRPRRTQTIRSVTLVRLLAVIVQALELTHRLGGTDGDIQMLTT